MFHLRQFPILATIAICSSCGGPPTATTASADLGDFECNDRKVAYSVVGGFTADESGVTMQCAESGAPTITKWRLDDGDRKEKTYPLSAEQFDDVWAKIDSTGWRHMEEQCDSSDTASGDPEYSMEVSDHALSAPFSCTGKTLPFPFDRIVNELDLRAAGFGDQDSTLL